MAAIFQNIFMNENAWISIRISLRFVHDGPINNISVLVLRINGLAPIRQQTII